MSSAGAAMGIATDASLYTNPLFIAVLSWIGSLLIAVFNNRAAAKRDRLNRAAQRQGRVGWNLFAGALLVLGGQQIWKRVTAEPKPTTTPAAAVPITFEEASAFALSYLETGDTEGTEDQVWDMYTDRHALSIKNGKKGVIEFWQTVDTVELAGEPSLVHDSTPGKAIVDMPLTYREFPNKVKAGSPTCTHETDRFTLVRVDGVLKIDDLTTVPGTFAVCK
jgi:hypothetical protein